jgi:hypothetical protein
VRRTIRFVGVFVGLTLLVFGNLTIVGAQGPPDFTKFGYPTVAKSMDIAPDQAVTITAEDRSIAIKAGTFDAPVTFDLLTADPKTWSDKAQGRTVRDAFAFRVTDKATKALVATFKQPVVYTYTDEDVKSTDAILNTTAANPPVVTLNATPITFADGKVSHSFAGAGVGWLLVSAAPNAAAGTSAPAAAPSAAAPSGGTTAAATGTGGGAVTTTLPQTGEAHATSANRFAALGLGFGAAALFAGTIVLTRRRVTGARR